MAKFAKTKGRAKSCFPIEGRLFPQGGKVEGKGMKKAACLYVIQHSRLEIFVLKLL